MCGLKYINLWLLHIKKNNNFILSPQYFYFYKLFKTFHEKKECVILIKQSKRHDIYPTQIKYFLFKFMHKLG